jgi:chaperonin GroEL (HSP60 family)
MGETIDETRLEIAAQRAEMETTADRLRDSLNLGRRIRENPGMVIGIGAAAAFLVAGGPRRLARVLRRRLSPNAAEQAYDALPSTMQTWVSTLAGEAGPRAGEVRDQLVEELKRWRRDPIKDKKARKELAKQMVEGPPGPARTAWTAADPTTMPAGRSGPDSGS